MTPDPFADLNRTHREHVDTPWSPPPRRHQFRKQWNDRRRPRHLSADSFDAEPLLVQLGRWLGPWVRRAAIVLVFTTSAYFVCAIIWALLAWPE